MRIRRMASAAAPKKCPRPSQAWFLPPVTRNQASCTSAVGCSVWPGSSLAILQAASFRSSSYTRGSNWPAAFASPCSMAFRTWVTSLTGIGGHWLARDKPGGFAKQEPGNQFIGPVNPFQLPQFGFSDFDALRQVCASCVGLSQLILGHTEDRMSLRGARGHSFREANLLQPFYGRRKMTLPIFSQPFHEGIVRPC